MRLEIEAAAKPCRGVCIDGWYHVAWEIDDSGRWAVYRYPCKCTYPGGLYLDELTQPHRFRRSPDYTTDKLSGKTLIHPRNNSLLFGDLREKVAKAAGAQKGGGLGEVMGEAVPF